MAGYNGRNGVSGENDAYINATAFNSQIASQRDALGSRLRLNQENNTNFTIGIGRSQESSDSGLFRSFDATEIMKAANDNFGSISYGGGENPDFRSRFDPHLFKSYDTIIAENQQPDGDGNLVSYKLDRPGIGKGPNLNSPDAQQIDDAMAGTLDNSAIGFTPAMEANYREGKGYGWYDSLHKSATIGGYLQNKYSFHASDTFPAAREGMTIDNEVRLGERMDVDAIDYSDDTQNS